MTVDILAGCRRGGSRPVTIALRRQPVTGQSAISMRLLGFTLRQHLLAIAIFASVTLAFFFPLVQGDTFSDVAARQSQTYPWAGAVQVGEFQLLHYDQDDSNYPWQVFMNREVRDGNLPFWNPYSFGGSPFFANGQSGVLYPPRLVLARTVSAARVHDLLIASHLFLAGVAMFVLLGFVGLSFPAALVGGLAWMLNSFGLAWQALEHYTAIEVYLPVAVLLAHAAVRRRSWLAACGLGIVLSLLFIAGNVLFAELAVAATLGYAVVLALLDARPDWTRLRGAFAGLAAAAGLGVGLAAISILPTIVLAGESARASLSYGQLGAFALSWSDLMYVFRPPPDVIKFDPYHHDLFAGTLVAGLALIGCLRREALARFAAVLGALTVLFMLHTPITFIVSEVLPGFDNFKPLSRAAFVLQFALAVLAAFGLDTLLKRLDRPAAGVWLQRLSIRASTAAAVLVGLVAGSILVQEWLWKDDVMLYQPAGRNYLYPPTPLLRELERRHQARFLPTNPALRGSTAMIFQAESAGGYESLLPARVQNFWRVMGEGLRPSELAEHRLIYAYHPTFQLVNVEPELLARAGVQLVVSPPEAVEGTPVPDGLEPVYSGSDGRIFAVAGALPRAYVVGGCVQTDSALSALERFSSAGFRKGEIAVLERRSLQDAGLSCSGGSRGRVGSATIVRRSPGSLLLFARAQRPGWLVVNDSWDEGWRATVDDRPADVLPANYGVRAVRLSAGEHTVRFSYEAPAFAAGAAISAISAGVALGWLALLLWSRRRRARASATGS